VAQLLAHCPALIDGETPKGRNAAHIAASCSAGCASIAELLLDLKPELAKGITQDNNTVLHLLCRFSWSSHDKDHAFLEKVWSLNPAALHMYMINNDGDTPYHYSLRARDEWCVKFFQPKLSCEEILACHEGHFPTAIEAVLRRGCGRLSSGRCCETRVRLLRRRAAVHEAVQTL